MAKLARATRKLLMNKSSTCYEGIKEAIEQVRCKYPKAFFQAIKSAIRTESTAVIAKEFRDSGSERAPTFDEYTRKLYWKDDRDRSLPWKPCRSERVEVSDDDMIRAIKWLASGKAVGLDALPDR